MAHEKIESNVREMIERKGIGTVKKGVSHGTYMKYYGLTFLPMDNNINYTKLVRDMRFFRKCSKEYHHNKIIIFGPLLKSRVYMILHFYLTLDK